MNNDWLKNLSSFLIIVFGYGLLINLMFFGLIGFRFDVFSIAGFGLVYYFITEEIITLFRPRRIEPPAAKGAETRGEKISAAIQTNKNAEKETAMQKMRKKMDALKFIDGKK